ncbi:cyanoexosortase A [Nostoc sp. JL33]|uniref:cyanoexosortase A n=1 Tax=Nostoc sp. JL33 TaxID=2815396 RepID=UPI0025E7E9E9|nr:cyanoexosortase A [Nostoc sp. JL33]MBN3869847.1 cyanoexosortase A [Nostoc sp. JL33]
MKISGFDIIEQLKKSNFWLSAIALGLTIIQLDLNWKFIGSIDALTLRGLFLTAILYLIWKKKHNLNLRSDLFSTLIGLLLISFILIKSLSLFWFESFFLKIFALFSFLGLALIASGIKGLKQYWQEFIILVMSLSDGLLISLVAAKVDVSLLAAKVSNFVLWYLGFAVYRQGVNVILPTGGIEIYPGCSGLNAILLLLQLSLVFILVFPINIFQKIMLPILAVSLAFIINIFRLVLMTLLVASNHQGFEYWHGESGSQIFSTISILAFGFVCHWILRENKPA